jgi:MFS family permease
VVDRVIGHSPGFISSAATAALAYVVLFGVLFSAPFYLESAGGLSAKDAGLWLTALPVGIAVVAPIGGRLRDRLGPGGPSLGGLMLVIGGLAWLAAGPARATTAVPALALIGAGMGLFIPANNAAIMTSAPASLAGSAGGLVSMIRGLGTGFGVAATGLIFGIFAGQGAASVPLSAAAGVQGMRAGAALLAAVVVMAGALTALRPPGSETHGAELT